jgi:orotate phosphoribosyltransferase
LECLDLIETASADLLGFACLIDRSNGKSNLNNQIISQVQINIPTYKENELPQTLMSIPAIKPGSRDIK